MRAEEKKRRRTNKQKQFGTFSDLFPFRSIRPLDGPLWAIRFASFQFQRGSKSAVQKFDFHIQERDESVVALHPIFISSDSLSEFIFMLF